MTIQAVLLDIEGTTSSVRFVYDEMFPFVRRELEGYLTAHWQSENLRATLDVLAGDAKQDDFASWCASKGIDPNSEDARQLARDFVLGLMDQDVKATGLKRLQGEIWQAGFDSGELKAHVYDDVPEALKRWQDDGLDVRIYSSGSIAAQKLFFGHTVVGNLLGYFHGHYDTTIGGKKEAASYTAIAQAFEKPAETILFVSDVPAELDAAQQAGMQTALSVRPGNAPVEDSVSHSRIESFAELPV